MQRTPKLIFWQQDAKRWDRQSADVNNVNLTKKQGNAEIAIKLHGNRRRSKRNAGQKIENLRNPDNSPLETSKDRRKHISPEMII